MNKSQSVLKMETKVDIKSSQGSINFLNLNHQLQQLEVYFSVHHIEEENNISFAWLKLQVYSLTWWESRTKTLRLEGDPLLTKWDDFKTLIKLQFYPIEYVDDQWISSHYFKQKLRKSMQEYTIEFKNMSIMLGISPKNPYVLLKYLEGLHRHLWEQVMFFKPKSMGEDFVQAQYLENTGLKKAPSSVLKQKEK